MRYNDKLTEPQPFTRFKRLYKCDYSTGQIEKYEFLEESIAEGASLPTWVLRDSAFKRIRTSPNGYYQTVNEAQLAWLENARRNLADGEANLAKYIQEQEAALAELRINIAKVSRLAEAPACQ